MDTTERENNEIELEQNNADFQKSLRMAWDDYVRGRVLTEEQFDAEVGLSNQAISAAE